MTWLTQRDITVRFTAPGWHHWPGAPEHRDYLGDRHRHLFHVEVTMPVDHDDREVEFHDLLEHTVAAWPGPELGGLSCESICADLAVAIQHRWNRPVTVSVFEDGEVGATFSFNPRET